MKKFEHLSVKKLESYSQNLTIFMQKKKKNPFKLVKTVTSNCEVIRNFSI